MSVEILSPYNIASPLNLSKIIKNGATWPLTHPFRGIRAWVGLFYHYTEIPLDDLEFQDLDARKLDSLSCCPALCRTVILILHLSVFGITPTCDRRKDTCHTIFYASATAIAQSVARYKWLSIGFCSARRGRRTVNSHRQLNSADQPHVPTTIPALRRKLAYWSKITKSQLNRC